MLSSGYVCLAVLLEPERVKFWPAGSSVEFCQLFEWGQDFTFRGDDFCFFPETICKVPQHMSVFMVLFAFKYFCCICNTVSAIWWYSVGVGVLLFLFDFYFMAGRNLFFLLIVFFL